MTQKELEKLSRGKLLELLAEQTGRADRLDRENSRLKERIAEREKSMNQLGRMTEALIRVSPGLSDSEREAAARELDEIRESNAMAESIEELEDAEATEDDQEESDEPPDWPTREQLLLAAQKERYKNRYVWSLKTTIYALLTVAAVAVLVAVLLLPVLQIYGTSMNPTLYEGDFVVSVKGSDMKTSDLVAFYYNNKILVKRVIAQAGQWVDIAEDGTVYVDNVQIEEPYLMEKAFGECDIELPYQVPESRVFVMGDNRDVSVDSRSTSIGCVAQEQIVGKIVFRIWPLSEIGRVGKA